MSIELKQAEQQVIDAWDACGRYPDSTSDLERLDAAINALRTAIQQAEAQQPATPEPVAWVSKTGHGTYFRESITPELASLEHGGRKMWRPLTYADTHPAPGVPEFSRIAKRKLDELQEQGFAITGYAIQRGTERGFITDGGFVGWWRSNEAPGVQGVSDDVVRDAISTVREQYRGTDWGKAAEGICDAIDATMLAAAQAQKGQP